MSDDQQPRAEWIFPEEKKSNTGRIWLIVILSVIAVAIVAALLFFFLPRPDDTPDATGSPTPSASPTSTRTPTSTPTPTPTPTATASPTPPPTDDPEPPPSSPPPADPDMETFVGQVRGPLDDGVHGLGLLQDNMDVGGQIVDSLQQDAQNLAGAAAPASIAGDWSAAVADYTARLGELRAALDNGADAQPALDASRASLSSLRGLVGL